MYYTKKEVEYYKAQRKGACKDLDISEYQYNKLRGISRVFKAIFVANCNGELTEKEYEKEYNQTEKELKDYLEKIEKEQLHYYIQTDPRGASLYLSTNEIEQSTYNTTASCIY